MEWNRFDIVEAHYWFCADYHGGQWTALYERLCKIGSYYSPGPMHRGFDGLSENGQAIYCGLVEKDGYNTAHLAG